ALRHAHRRARALLLQGAQPPLAAARLELRRCGARRICGRLPARPRHLPPPELEQERGAGNGRPRHPRRPAPGAGMSEVATLEATTVPVDERSLAGVREAAVDAATPLVWLLHSDVVPAADALPALLAHAPGPAASLPVGALDRPVVPLLGRVTESDAEGLLAGIAQH